MTSLLVTLGGQRLALSRKQCLLNIANHLNSKFIACLVVEAHRLLIFLVASNEFHCLSRGKCFPVVSARWIVRQSYATCLLHRSDVYSRIQNKTVSETHVLQCSDCIRITGTLRSMGIICDAILACSVWHSLSHPTNGLFVRFVLKSGSLVETRCQREAS